jgi:hexosaminidase
VCFNEVLVHLDLKGAPPKFDFLMDLIRFLGKGNRTSSSIITGFLMEFEDMLPFEGSMRCVRRDKYACYSQDQIDALVALITGELKLRLVPLVQTFSHLEYVLKRP